MPVDEAQLRGGFGQERYEKAEMQKQVYKHFMTLCEEPAEKERWTMINAKQTIEEVHDAVVKSTQV